jgi:hypothetical protein
MYKFHKVDAFRIEKPGFVARDGVAARFGVARVRPQLAADLCDRGGALAGCEF